MKHLNPKLTVLFNDSNDAGNRLVDLFDTLDRLHSAASEGRLAETTSFSAQELVTWLQEVVYTAEETIREIQADSDLRTVYLHVVEKPATAMDKRQA